MIKKAKLVLLVIAAIICSIAFANTFANNADFVAQTIENPVNFYNSETGFRTGDFENAKSIYAEVSMISVDSCNADVYIASYTENNLLQKAVVFKNIPLNANEIKKYTTENFVVSDAEKIKVFAFNSETFAPLLTTPGYIEKTGVKEAKFEALSIIPEIGKEYSLGEFFKSKSDLTNEIDNTGVVLEFPETVTYKADSEDWAKGTITVSEPGEITLTIYDHFLCEKTTATFTVIAPEVKFKAKEVTLVANSSTKLGDMFAEIEGLFNPVNDADVSVTINGEATYAADTSSWENGTVTATGAGTIEITITDNNLCISTTASFTVVEPVERFAKKFKNDYLYKVGNLNTVSLGTLFEATSELGNVSVKIESADENIEVSGDCPLKTDWSTREITFKGTGLAKITITDDNIATIPTELYVEVIDAKNITANENASSCNLVLLKDISGGGFTVSNGYTYYGNGFKVTCAGDGSYSSKLLTQGYIYVTNGSTLEDTQVICDIYPKSYMFTNEMQADGTDRYPYARSAVVIEGNSKISGCYIHGARTNIYAKTGNITIEDTVTENGSFANIHIDKSSNIYTVTLDNITTIQTKTTSKYDENAIVLGLGIVVGDNESDSNPTIKLLGDLKQYNWVSESDKDISNTYAETALNSALSNSNYINNFNGKDYINFGIVYMNQKSADIIDNRNEGAPEYKLDTIKITIQGITATGQVYSIKSGSGITTDNGFNAETDGVLPYSATKTNLYKPQFILNDTTLGDMFIKEVEGNDSYCYVSGNTVKVMFVTGDSYTLDLKAMVSLKKYSGQDLSLNIAVRDSSGNTVSVSDNKLMLTSKETYTVTYSVTDTIFYNKIGEKIPGTINYSWDAEVSVSLKDISTPDAEIIFDTSKQKVYNDETKLMGTGDYVQMVQFLDGLRIYDYIGQEKYLRFNGDTDFNKIAKVSLGEAWSSGSSYYHTVTIELVDGGILYVDVKVSSGQGGSSTHNGSIFVGDLDGDGNKNLVFANNGKTAQVAQTWIMPRYEFKGNNGVSVKTSLNPFGSKDNCVEDISKPSATFSTTINATVYFEGNEGSCVQTKAYSTSVSKAVTLPKPTRAGYAFVGWFTAASGGTKVGGAGDSYTPSANITLYAQWGKPSTVTYDANGGSCDITSERFTGDALILPSATLEGKAHTGWYTAPTGGTRVGAAGESYVPTADITLYAQWITPPTVTYNANGGSCSTTSATYTTTALTLPTATRSGYRFTGWYTAASGGTKAGDAGAAYTPSADITLYAQWIQQYTVTYNANSGSVSPSSATCDEGSSVTLPTPARSNYDFNGWYTASSGGTKVGGAGASYKPTADITLYAQWTEKSSNPCVTGDTLITLADRSKVAVKDLKGDEILLVWNHDTGAIDTAPIAYICNHGGEVRLNEVITLKFDDGKKIEIIGAHIFFDREYNRYVELDSSNAESFIGHRFAVENNGKLGTAKLVSCERELKNTDIYEVVTYKNITCFTGDILSASGYVMPLLGAYEIDDSMKYTNKAEDIEKYGLYTYDDFKELVPEVVFNMYDAKNLKVMIGKGYMSWDDVLKLVDFYYSLGITPIPEI